MRKETVLAVFTLISLLFIMFETRFIVVPVEAYSGTIYVDANNTGDPLENGSLGHPFDKIQEGIDAASSGDTVFVYTGIYSEYVFVNKSLTLIGEDADTTIIEGVSGTGPVVECYNASNVKISGFTIRQRSHGIDLNNCDNITISGNMVTNNNQYGIFLENSRNITISNNMIINNGIRGVYLRSSRNNTVSNNTISTHSQYGIYLFSSRDNVVIGNTISNTNDRGIWLNGGRNNIFSGNIISKNSHGLYILYSTRNTLRNNNMSDNRYNFFIDGSSISHYIQDIDPSNIVDGKPVYYWVNQRNKQVPYDAGYVALVNSTNIIVKDLNLTKNRQGVLVAYTTNSTIMNASASYNYIGVHVLESSNNSVISNILTNNQRGIELKDSSDNTLTRNTITNNDWGIFSAQGNNTIYHNNFINNTEQVQAFISSNMWDDGYPSGGNYWSDYPSVDEKHGPNQDQLGSDGISDTPYLIPEDNPDNYPLITPVIVADQIIINKRSNVGSLQTIAFHAIWAHNTSNVVRGSVYVNSTQYFTNSTGWITFNATYDTVGKLVWTITSSSSFYLIWDRVQITLNVADDRIDVGSNASISWTGIYEYDGKPFTGSVSLNDTTVKDGVGKYGYTVQAISDPIYGIAAFTSNSVDCIWDRIQIVEGGFSQPQTTITETETIWFKAIYEYDGSVFDGTKGTLYVNGSAMTWSTVKERWKYNSTFNTPGNRAFKISGISDGQYGLTAINDLVGAQSITWKESAIWANWWFWIIIGIVVAVVVVAIYFLRK